MADWKPKPGLQYEGAAVIRVAGHERFIPVLAMRQNRTVVPLLLKVLPLIEAAGERTDAATGEIIPPPPEAVMRLFEGDTISVMNMLVYTALTRAYDITLDDYLDEAVSVHELSMAMPAIMKQTKFFEKPAEGRARKTGEDQATI